MRCLGSRSVSLRDWVEIASSSLELGDVKGSRVLRFSGCTHSVEINDYGPVCFHHCRFASQRYDFAEDADSSVGEGIEILGVNTRSSFGGHLDCPWMGVSAYIAWSGREVWDGLSRAVVGGWRLMVDGWWLVFDGWWFG